MNAEKKLSSMTLKELLDTIEQLNQLFSQNCNSYESEAIKIRKLPEYLHKRVKDLVSQNRLKEE